MEQEGSTEDMAPMDLTSEDRLGLCLIRWFSYGIINLQGKSIILLAMSDYVIYYSINSF